MKITRLLGMFIVAILLGFTLPIDGWGDDLIYDGSVCYGMLPYGGDNDYGMIYKVNPGDPDLTTLYSFTGGIDGKHPQGYLTLSGSCLYGMSSDGGTYGYGAIFKVNKDGTGFTNIYSFAGGTDGSSPHGSLVLSGSVFYGMTSRGGSQDKGTIFKISEDGTDYAIIHSFAGGSGDGAYPSGDLTIVDLVLYGMTPNGGTYGLGVIFSINANGSGLTVMHSFEGGSADGANPSGNLIQTADTTLSGVTPNGGATGSGVAFSINMDSSNYSITEHLPLGVCKRWGGTVKVVLSDDGCVRVTRITIFYIYYCCKNGMKLGEEVVTITITSFYGPDMIIIGFWDDSISDECCTTIIHCKEIMIFRCDGKYLLTYELIIGIEENCDPECQPLLTTLLSFKAITLNNNVLVEWETASETDTVGFHIWRSIKNNGNFRRITSQIISAQGSAISGSKYTFYDTSIATGKTYYYKLEDIDTKGVSTFHGPVKAKTE